MMKEKGIVTGRIWAAAMMLFWLNGCSATGPSLGGILSPKKKVPPLEEMTLPPPGQPAAAAAPQQPAPPPAGQGEAAMTEPAKPAAGPAPQPRVDPVLFNGMADYVSGRINHYRDVQSRWQELESGFASRATALPEPERWQKCTEAIGAVLDGYFSLHTWLASDGSKAGEEGRQSSPFHVFQQDTAFLEGDCPQLFATAAAVIPGELRGAALGAVAGREEAAVRYWAQRGDNAQVITAYENLAAAGLGKHISPETRELYAKALRASGKFAQAAEALLAAAAQYQDEWRSWPLRLQAAELLFATGEFARARGQYEQLAALFAKVRGASGEVDKQLGLLGGEAEHGPELTLYSKALHGSLQFDGEHAPPELADSVQQLETMYPGSNYARLARELLGKAGGPAARSADEALTMARQLAAEKKFSEALELLAPYSRGAASEEAAASVRALEEEIRKEQAAQTESDQSAQQGILDAKWQKALQALDQRQYDQAITLFAEFADSPYQEQAKGKITEAMNLAAADLRKEAASLFIKARKSGSTEQKSTLLAESRRLLVLIQEKYPQADIIDKVKLNQKAIDEQLMSLNPRQQQGE